MVRKKLLNDFNESRIVKKFCFGIIIGIVSGLMSVFYRYLITLTDMVRKNIYEIKDQKLIFVLIGFLFIAVVAAKLLRWAPYSGGSGIPQIKAELDSKIQTNAKRIIVSKITGGSLLNIVGLSLGREGPSIQIGGMVGKVVAEVFHLSENEMKSLIACGAGAGLAAAFNAPIAGVMFCIEELHKKVSTSILVPTITATTVANIVSYMILGNERTFSFKMIKILPLKYTWIPVIIAIVTGIVGVIFNRGILKSQDLWKRSGLKMELRVMLLVVIGLIIGVFFFPITGGGHNLVEEFANKQYGIGVLILILILKLTYTVIAFGCGVQGGIFLPVLVIGSIVGSCVYQILDPTVYGIYLNNFLILGMVGILTSVVRAPILAIILVLEMTGTFAITYMVAVVCVISMIVAELLDCPPIYDSLYDRIVRKK